MIRDISSGDPYAYHEITLSGHGLSFREKGKAREVFFQAGVPGPGLALTDYQGNFRLSCYTRSFRKAERLRKNFQKFRIRKLKFRIKTLHRRDWFDKWKLDYHIRPIGKRFMVVPLWEKQKFKFNRRMPIFLEPASAFGSGYHETTRLMVRLLESLSGKMRDFLDIGTGTGILSVAASKLGAGKVAGFDNDKPSVAAARKNFQLNGCQHGKFFGAKLKQLKLQDRFYVVGANLISKVLLECQGKILSSVRKGGYLLVSGISRENLPDFQRKFAPAKLKCLKILRSRKWTALLYQRI
ncbi:MAG TPA: 50S ribosomal protein L11 methyltransferase [Candidatus Omnitrophota bacterium]|nr:50S ribosomal protein L11 methyltransferase [Candidatus Omnitrophota bacterium]